MRWWSIKLSWFRKRPSNKRRQGKRVSSAGEEWGNHGVHLNFGLCISNCSSVGEHNYTMKTIWVIMWEPPWTFIDKNLELHHTLCFQGCGLHNSQLTTSSDCSFWHPTKGCDDISALIIDRRSVTQHRSIPHFAGGHLFLVRGFMHNQHGKLFIWLSDVDFWRASGRDFCPPWQNAYGVYKIVDECPSREI